MPTKPNLFIVGVQKAGTSALAGWLSQHPQVFMSFPKEPGYLAFGDAGYQFRDGNGLFTPAHDFVVDSLEDYLALFDSAGTDIPVMGEASTWYFAIPGMAQRIQAFNQEARVIVVLRNPVDRAYSAWCHARRDNMEPMETFSAALDAEPDRNDIEYLLRYTEMSCYSEHLAEYQECFGTRLQVLFYQDLRDQPDRLFAQVCDFLSIDRDVNIDFGQRYNASGQPRVKTLQALVGMHRLRKFVRGFIPYSVLVKIKQGIDRVNLQPFPALPEVDRQRLIREFRADIEALMELTGRDLQSWLK
ncbi:MAG: sulfotransferase domain-containing protein [bacterium]